MTLSQFIWSIIKEQKWKFFFMFFLSLSWACDATLWPYILGHIVDTFNLYDTERGSALPALKWLLIGGISLWIVVELSFRIRSFLQAYAIPRMEAAIRMKMFEHVQAHSPKYFNEHFSGSLANKISDMTTQVTSMMQILLIFFPVFATCLFAVIFFSQVNALFALLLAGLIISHYSVCFLFTPKCIHYAHIHAEARSSLAGKIVDSLTNNFAVNLFYRFAHERAQLTPYQSDELSKNTQAQRYTAWMFTTLSGVFLCGIVAINGYMLYSWLHGKTSTGEAIQIFNTTWYVVFSSWMAGEQIPIFFNSVGIAKQALSLMHHPQDILDKPDAKPLALTQGEIRFENVTFQYGNKKLFENKHVHIKGGEKVGLVGYSGAGKSTFVNLILRFHPVEAGKITVDGQDIANVTLSSLRSQVALIPQDPLLFHRSLKENIRYGKLAATDQEIQTASQLAHCNTFIQHCPAGYDTLVGERGTKLSGGERQRIAIARALLTHAPILILDEATSALDSVTEKCIQDSLEMLMKNRTTLVVAHRLSTLAKMDRILVFDQGKIVEEGTHAQLLAHNGHYARMWQKQAGGFLPDQPQENA